MITSPIIIRSSSDGTTYRASLRGGWIIQHVSVYLIFWGPNWADPKATVLANQIQNAVDALLRGPYFIGLRQYGIGRGTLGGVAFDFSPAPNPFKKPDWRGKIWDVIGAGEVPGPVMKNLYMFVLEPGILCDDPLASGDHGADVRYGLFGNVGVVFGGFVTVPIGDPSDAVKAATRYLSHEIVEACTDPVNGAPFNLTDGWTLDGLDHPHCEVCDQCDYLDDEVVNGIFVSGYWSNLHNACVVPVAYSLRETLRSKGLDPGLGLAYIRPPVTSVLSFVAGD
jgi:hypothetical protein